MGQDFYFEDMPVGFHREGGHYELTEEEVIDFGRRYDPLPIHVDREAARASQFGGLIAAGTHILAVATRLVSDLNRGDSFHYICGMGFEEVRFHRPAYAGDVLSVRIEVVAARRSESQPDRGILTMQQTVKNQNGDIISTLKGLAWIACRPAR